MWALLQPARITNKVKRAMNRVLGWSPWQWAKHWSEFSAMFRICSEFWVIFRIFRHFSEFLAQKLVYSESLDFVVRGTHNSKNIRPYIFTVVLFRLVFTVVWTVYFYCCGFRLVFTVVWTVYFYCCVFLSLQSQEILNRPVFVTHKSKNIRFILL
jgi:hypothetical protein